MVGMPLVGSVGVQVSPTFRGTQRAIGKEFSGAADHGAKTFNTRFGSALRAGAKWAAGGAAVAIGTALTQGFRRLTAIENAQASLRGLGHDAQSVEQIMQNANAAVKGTAFGLGDAATAAASAVAAGVKPGEDLERTLTLMGDAAQIAGVGINEMGSIVNKVATSDMMQMDVANQLMDAGIPILQLVGEEMGVTAEEARKLASDGKVSFEIFQNALESGLGGAAQSAGETLQGAFANSMAAIGRFGANLMTGVYPQLREFFTSFIEWMGPVEEMATVWGEQLGEALKSTVDWISENTELIKDLAGAAVIATGAWVAYTGSLKAYGAVKTATDAVKGFRLALEGTEKALLILRNSGDAAQAGAKAFETLNAPLRAARGAAEGFELAQSGITTGLSLANPSVRAGAGFYNAYAGAANLAAAGQRAFNWATMNVQGALSGLAGAMRAHPIMAIASVLAAAAAGLTYFFTQTETGQKAWESLKTAMEPVTEAIMPVLESMGSSIGETFSNLASTAGPVIADMVSRVGEFAAQVIPTLMDLGGTIFDALVPVFQTIGDFIMSIGPTLVEFGSTIFEALVPVFQTIGEYLAPMIAEIGDALAPLLPMFAEAGQQIMEAFVPVVDQVMNELVPAFAELWQALSGIIPQLIEALAPILPLIAEAFSMLVQALAPLVPMLINALAPIIPMLADAFGMLLTALVPVVATIVQSLLPMLPILVRVFSELVGAILPLIPILIEALAPIIPLIVNAFLSLVQAILPLIPLLISSLIPVVTQLITIAFELVAALLPVAIAFVQSVIPAVLAVLPVLVKLIVFVIEMLVPVIEMILSVVVTVFEALAPIIEAALMVVQGVIETITALISGDWEGVWEGIKTILYGVWEFIKSTVTGALDVVWSVITGVVGLIMSWWDTAWNAVASALSWVWETLIQPVFRALGEFLEWVYVSFIEPVLRWILEKWETMQRGLSHVYDNYIKPMFDRFGEIVQDLRDKFETAVDNIKKAWDKIKSVAAKPIKFVIEKVINEGLIDGFNTLVDWIPGVDGLKHVPLPGWMDEYDRGGYTGDGGKYEPAGIVHRGEYVLPKEATTSLMRTIGIGGLEYMRHHGRLPGYSGGGLVQPVRGPLTSRFGPRWGSHHSGVDWAVPVGTPVRAAMGGTVLEARTNAVPGRTGKGVLLAHPGNRHTYYGHLSAYRAAVGEMVSQGQIIALSGNTGNSTGPHLHFETWTGRKPVNPLRYLNGEELPEGGEGGGGWDILAPFRAIGEKITEWFKDRFPDGGIFVDAAVNTAKSGFDSLLNWAGSLIGLSGDNEGGSGSGDVKDQVRAVAAEFGWDSGEQWNALSRIIEKESSWDTNAANPSSSARGLFQLIAANRNADYRDVQAHAREGMSYIRGRYVSPRTALDFHNRNNWYADGGLVDHHLFRDRGGNLPPGLSMVLNNRGHDETILPHTPRDVEAAFLRQGSNAGVTINGNVWAHSPEQVAQEIHKDARRAAALAPVL